MPDPNSALAAKLREALFRKGWPGAPAGRVVREVAEHWEDLEAEGREEGLDATAAAQRADERLGDVDGLVRQLADTFCRASYAGRHPWLCFLLLPLLGVIGWFIGWAMVGLGLSELLIQLKLMEEPLYRSETLVTWGAEAIWYSGMILVPLLAWRWATRSFCGHKWGWIACAICAAHGLFNFIHVSTQMVQWGYSVSWNLHWSGALTPLAAVGLAHLWERYQRSRAFAASWRVALLAGLLTAATATGCASGKAKQKEALHRGWIGGEYAEAKAGLMTGPNAVAAFPRELKNVQSAGILITGLRTNTPAFLGGLREGDLILKAGPHVTKSISAFRKSVAATCPGTTLALSLYRDGETLEQPVTVGTEIYQQWHAFNLGLMLSPKVDLWPDPTFSWIAVGYACKARWLDLASPEARFIQQCHAPERGLDSGQSWQLWLGLVGFSGYERILQQNVNLD